MFYLSTTYSETTPESVEHGDFSETGFSCEGEKYSYSELLNLIDREGFHSVGADWISTGYHTTDYATGTEREESLHIDRSKSSARAVRLWDALNTL